MILAAASALTTAGVVPTPHEATAFSFEDTYARLAGDELTIGTSHVKRTWRVKNGLLYATSFRSLDKGGSEWIGVPPALPSPYPAFPLPDEPRRIRLRGANGAFGPTESPSLRVELEAAGASATVRYEFQVFPGAPGIRIWTDSEAPGKPSAANKPASEFPQEDALEHLLLTNPHLRLTHVALYDRSDFHNELALENEWLLHPNEALLRLNGNLYFVEDTLTGSGLVLLKEASLPETRPVAANGDLRVRGSGMMVSERAAARAGRVPAYQASLYGNGLAGPGRGDAFVLLAYTGGRTGRIIALQDYQRRLRNYDPSRDGKLVSNTWGDRSQDRKISEDFMKREIDAAAKLGVDVVQIDYGWQLGNAGKATSGFGPWDPSPKRFPNGLDAVVEYARGKGMAFGLWYQPDSANDSANWQQDAAHILRLYRLRYGSYFKLDGIILGSRLAEQRFRALLDRLLNETNGRIALNLDITAQSRLGYFGAVQAGALFVENRYTDGHRYWPHQTLRNLWKLAQYVDPVRLQMEFLNSERNTGVYPSDPLAPNRYRADYLFATAMFGSPLAFLETSGLSDRYIAEMAPLVRTWKQHRETMFRGRIIPIGVAPDGVNWTGFVSFANDRRSGYILVFRELNSQATWSLPLDMFERSGYSIERLGGNGSATQNNGVFSFEIPERPGFAWFRVSK